MGTLTVGAMTARTMVWSRDPTLAQGRDAAWAVLVTAEGCRACGAWRTTRPLWQVGVLSNPPLAVRVLASLALQLALHHLPPPCWCSHCARSCSVPAHGTSACADTPRGDSRQSNRGPMGTLSRI